MNHHFDPASDRRQFRDRRIPSRLLPTLAHGKVRSLPEPFCVVSLPSAKRAAAQRFVAELDAPFTNLSGDDKAVTLVIPEAAWRAAPRGLGKGEVEKGYRVFALEGDADWSAPGFVGVISRCLGEGGIGAGVICGFKRLFLLVKTRQAKDARIQLDLLANQARGRLAKQSRGSADL